MSTETTTSALLDASETAAELRLSRDAVYRLARSGKIPAMKTAGDKGEWRFDLDAVKAALKFTATDTWARPAQAKRATHRRAR